MKPTGKLLPKTIILVRHGEYRDGPVKPLTLQGREQIRTLGKKLRLFVSWDIFVLTSLVERARSSAEIIAETLWCDDPKPLLELDTTRGTISKETAEVIIKQIHQCKSQTVILVGHLELLSQFTWYLGQKLGKNFIGSEYPKGTALVFDTATGTMTFVGPEN